MVARLQRGGRALDHPRDGLRPGEPRRFRSKQGLVDLAAAAQRQLVLAAQPKMARDFVARELGAAVLEQRGGLDGSRRNDECGHVLATRARRHRHDVRRADGRVAEQRRLDLGRRDVGARRLDHVFDAAEKAAAAILSLIHLH